MTTTDYIGTIIAIIIAVLMLGAYIYAFRPGNKDKFDKSKTIPLDE